MNRDVLKVVAAVLVVSGLVAAGAGLPPLRIYDEGVALAQRFRLSFIGNDVSCVDNSATSTTDCTFSAVGPVPMSSSGKWNYAWIPGWGVSSPAGAPSWYPRDYPGAAFTTTGCTLSATKLGTSPNVRNGPECLTATTAASTAGISNTNGVEFLVSHGIYGCFYALLTATDRPTRAWIGFSSTPTNMTASNTPTESYVAFRYAPSIGSTWYACQDTASGSPTCTDTTVAADTSVHLFCIDCSTGSCTLTIDGAGSVSLGATKRPTAVMGWGINLNNGATDGGRSGTRVYFGSVQSN